MNGQVNYLIGLILILLLKFLKNHKHFKIINKMHLQINNKLNNNLNNRLNNNKNKRSHLFFNNFFVGEVKGHNNDLSY